MKRQETKKPNAGKKTLSVIMALSFIMLAFSFNASATATQTTTDTFTDASGLIDEQDGKIIVCAGDSITVGSQDSPGSGGYPGRLNYTLQLDGANINVINSGLNSDTLLNLRYYRANRIDAYNPDYLFIQIGTNDLRIIYGDPSGNPVSVDQFEENYTFFIQEIYANNPNVTIAIGTIPPLDDYYQGSFLNQTLFNTAIRNVSALFDISLLDFHDYMYNHGNVSWVGVDKSHPNSVGYHYMAKRIYELWFSNGSNGISTGSGLDMDTTPKKRINYIDPLIGDWGYSGVVSPYVGAFPYANTRMKLESGIGQTARINITVIDYLNLVYSKSTSGGIVEIYFNSVLLDTIDTYNPGNLFKQSVTYYPTEGYGEFVVLVVGKNASSSDYQFSLEAIKTMYGTAQARATSTINTKVAGLSSRVSYSATRNAVERLITPRNFQTMIDPSTNDSIEDDINSYSYIVGELGLQGSGETVLNNTITTTLIGFNSATFHFALDDDSGWVSVYVDSVKVSDVNLTGTSDKAWYEEITVDLGSYGEHTVMFDKGTNSSIMYMLGVRYWTYNINFFTGTDGENWTLTNETYADNTGENVYYRFVFYGSKDAEVSTVGLDSVTIQFTYDSAVTLLIRETTDILIPIFTIFIALSILIAIVNELKKKRF